MEHASLVKALDDYDSTLDLNHAVAQLREEG